MSRDTRRFVASFALLLLLLPPSLSAQQIPQLGETIEVSIVNVDVFVTDKQGNRVRGLTRDDFEIRESGKVQPITNFAEYGPVERAATGTAGVDVAAEKVGTAGATSAAPVKRTMILFIESFTMPDFHARPFFDGLRDLVRRTVRPGDSVAVVSWAKIPLIRQEFTDDLAAIEAALAKVEKESTGPYDDPTAVLRRQAAFEEAFVADLQAAGFATDGAASADFDSLSEATFELFRIRQKTEAVKSFMQSMSGVEGKKVMVLALHRFGTSAGAEYFTGGVVPKEREGGLDTRSLRDELSQMANANGITLYPLYPVGMSWTPRANASQVRANVYAMNSDMDLQISAIDNSILMNETATRTELADRTGGLAHYGSRNIVELLPQIADDIESYYSLGYRATTRDRDDTRRISVTPKNRDYVVRSRQQFVEKSDETKMSDHVVANLFQSLGVDAIPIEAELGDWTRSSKNRWTAPLKVRIPIKALTTVDGANGPTGGFSVYIASGGILGVIGEVKKHTQPFQISRADIERAQDSHFTYDVTLEVDQFTRRVSIGVFDEVSRQYGLERLQVLPQQPSGSGGAGRDVPAS